MTEMEIEKLAKIVADNIKKDSVTLAQANKLISLVMKKAEEMGVKAVVAVADRHANPISVQCMDDAYIASYDIAVNKAYTVTALKMPTTNLKKLAAPGGDLYGIQFTNGGKIVIFGGGEPLMENGILVGSVGVSGGSEAEDAYLAEFALKVFKGEKA